MRSALNTHEWSRPPSGSTSRTSSPSASGWPPRGGAERVRDEFDSFRARRLFQAVLSTGRYAGMSEHWRESVDAGVEVGTLARPESN